MQQNGGIIPGIRQGRATSDYLSRVSGRLTLFSALFLAVLATIPTMLTRIFGITAPFGASSVLIAVSVASRRFARWRRRWSCVITRAFWNKSGG